MGYKLCMFDKPLFSRKQLNIIILVTTLAIVLLASTGKPTPLPQVQQQQVAGTPLYSVQNNAVQHRLRLSFALPTPYAAHRLDALLLQRLLLTQMQDSRQRAPFSESDANIQLSLRADRFIVDLTLTELDELKRLLPALIQQLQQPPDSALLLDAATELEARTYLEHQQLSAAQQQMAFWLEGRPQTALDLQLWQAFKARTLSRAQLSLSLISTTPEAALPALASLQQLPSGYAWVTPGASFQQPQSRDYQQGEYYIVQLGRPIPGRSSPAFQQQQIALRLLQHSAEAEGLSSHWQALATQGWLEFSAYSQKPISADMLLTRLSNHIKQLSDTELTDFTDTVATKFEDVISQPSDLLEQLDAIAFYQLPTNYLQSFSDGLAQLTPDQLRQDALNLLAAEDYFVVTERPLN